MNKLGKTIFFISAVLIMVSYTMIGVFLMTHSKEKNTPVPPQLVSIENSISGSMDRRGAPQKITVIVYEDRDQLQEAYEASGYEGQVMGWAIYRPSDRAWGCTVHVTKIANLKDGESLNTWGHELAHCVYGSFHK